MRILGGAPAHSYGNVPILNVHSTGLRLTGGGPANSAADLRVAKPHRPTTCFPRQAFPYSLFHALLPRRVASRCTGPFPSGVVALGDKTTVRKYSPCLQVCCGTSRTSLCKYPLLLSDCLR